MNSCALKTLIVILSIGLYITGVEAQNVSTNQTATGSTTATTSTTIALKTNSTPANTTHTQPPQSMANSTGLAQSVTSNVTDGTNTTQFAETTKGKTEGKTEDETEGETEGETMGPGEDTTATDSIPSTPEPPGPAPNYDPPNYRFKVLKYYHEDYITPSIFIIIGLIVIVLTVAFHFYMASQEKQRQIATGIRYKPDKKRKEVSDTTVKSPEKSSDIPKKSKSTTASPQTGSASS